MQGWWYQPTILVTSEVEARESHVQGYLEQFSETLPISIIKQKVKKKKKEVRISLSSNCLLSKCKVTGLILNNVNK